MGGVEGEVDLVAEVAADPSGGFAAVVGGDSADDQFADVLLLQPGVEVGAAVETGVHALGDQQLGFAAEDRSQRVSRTAGVQWGFGVTGVVPDEDHGQVFGLPGLDERGDIEWWPKTGETPEVIDVPESISRAAKEAYSSASVGTAILMARTVVEATAKNKGILKGSLATKINQLAAHSYVRPAISEQAHEVRFAGNDMAHGDIDVEPDATDSEEILALMAEVLAEVFQGPARLERIRNKRKAQSIQDETS